VGRGGQIVTALVGMRGGGRRDEGEGRAGQGISLSFQLWWKGGGVTSGEGGQERQGGGSSVPILLMTSVRVRPGGLGGGG